MLERKLSELSVNEYVEKVSGIKLTVYQRKMLELADNLPEGSCIVMGRKGPIILDSNGRRIDHVKETYERRNHYD